MSAAVTTVGDGNTQYVDGLALMTNSATRLADGLYHPNATGSAEIAATLSNLVN